MATALMQKVLGYGYSAGEVPSQAGKSFIVTGGTNGMGLSIARTLYAHGAKVVITGSQEVTSKQALAYIKSGKLEDAPEDYASSFGLTFRDASSDGATTPGEVISKVIDFKDLSAVAKLAKELASEFKTLDGFLGIAGIGVKNFELTKDGFDHHLTINNLAHILLLSHLLPVLEKTSREVPSSDVRIVLMSSELARATFGGPSEAYGGDKFRTVDEFRKDIGQLQLYGRTKLAVQLEAKALLQRYLKSTDILVFTTHPGGVATGQTAQYEEAYGTIPGKIIQAVVRPLMKSADDGCLSALWAATSPELRTEKDKYPSGSYFLNPQAPLGTGTHESEDQELIDNFWNTSLEVIKIAAGPDALGPFKG